MGAAEPSLPIESSLEDKSLGPRAAVRRPQSPGATLRPTFAVRELLEGCCQLSWDIPRARPAITTSVAVVGLTQLGGRPHPRQWAWRSRIYRDPESQACRAGLATPFSDPCGRPSMDPALPRSRPSRRCQCPARRSRWGNGWPRCSPGTPRRRGRTRRPHGTRSRGRPECGSWSPRGKSWSNRLAARSRGRRERRMAATRPRAARGQHDGTMLRPACPEAPLEVHGGLFSRREVAQGSQQRVRVRARGSPRNLAGIGLAKLGSGIRCDKRSTPQHNLINREMWRRWHRRSSAQFRPDFEHRSV